MARNKSTVVLILLIWFVISFVTNILGPIMPEIIDRYRLSLTLAAFLPFSFFLAYGIMSIPAGILIEKYGEKPSMLIAFGLNLFGVISFAIFPVYIMALSSLFIVGLGMAMLQVIINPLMRVAGGEEHFAFYSVLAQGIFGSASFISPFFFIYLLDRLKDPGEKRLVFSWLRNMVPSQQLWSALYWVFALIFMVMLLLIFLIPFPKVELKEEEKVGPLGTYIQLLRKRQVWLFFLGIMAYVGLEQGIANWLSKFLNTYHYYSLETGATAIAWFWGSMAIGCLVGLFILKLYDSKIVLMVFSVLTMVSLAIGIFGPAKISLFAFPACGFFIAMIFSIIFSLALNSEPSFHGSFSGILCSGIFGGALIPLIIGELGDHFGLRPALLFLFIPLGYIFSISIWSRPLINNETIRLRELFIRKGN